MVAGAGTTAARMWAALRRQRCGHGSSSGKQARAWMQANLTRAKTGSDGVDAWPRRRHGRTRAAGGAAERGAQEAVGWL